MLFTFTRVVVLLLQGGELAERLLVRDKKARTAQAEDMATWAIRGGEIGLRKGEYRICWYLRDPNPAHGGRWLTPGGDFRTNLARGTMMYEAMVDPATDWEIVEEWGAYHTLPDAYESNPRAAA